MSRHLRFGHFPHVVNWLTDVDQKRLALLYQELSKKKEVYLILRNSDPRNENPTTRFLMTCTENSSLIEQRYLASLTVTQKNVVRLTNSLL